MRSSRWIAALGFTVAVLVLSGCTSTSPGVYHGYMMSGTVTEVHGDEVVFCTGRSREVEVGQELQVVSTTRRPRQPSNPGAGARIDHETVGSVRVIDWVDSHHARASVVSGRMRQGFVVKLEDTGGTHSTSRS